MAKDPFPTIEAEFKPKSIDWKRIEKDFFAGKFASIKDFLDWNENQKIVDKYTVRPAKKTLSIHMHKNGWMEKAAEMHAKDMDKILDKMIDRRTEANEKYITRLAEARLGVLEAEARLLNAIADNPQNVQWKGNVSDIINDSKRTAGMITKENETQSQTNIQNNLGDDAVDKLMDSRRKELETSDKKERKLIEHRNRNMNEALRDECMKSADAEVIDG